MKKYIPTEAIYESFFGSADSETIEEIMTNGIDEVEVSRLEREWNMERGELFAQMEEI